MEPVVMQYRTVELAGLELGAGAAFRFRWTLPGEEESGDMDESLVSSIGTVGMISPPVLIEADGRHEIISGFRRIAAAREAGLEKAPVLVIEEQAEGQAGALPVWLESSLHGQALSEMERLTLAVKALALAGDRITESLPLLSRLFSRRITTEFLDRLSGLSQLDDEVKRAIHEGRVSPGDLLQISAHPGIDTGDAARLLAGSGLSRSGRREAVRGMLGLADHGKDLFARFVEEYVPEEMPLDESLNSITHPVMTGDISFLKRTITEIELPPAASVHLPENLEGSSFTVEIRVRDGDDLSISLERLREASDAAGIEDMLKVLQGKA